MKKLLNNIHNSPISSILGSSLGTHILNLGITGHNIPLMCVGGLIIIFGLLVNEHPPLPPAAQRA